MACPVKVNRPAVSTTMSRVTQTALVLVKRLWVHEIGSVVALGVFNNSVPAVMRNRKVRISRRPGRSRFAQNKSRIRSDRKTAAETSKSWIRAK